MSTQPDERIDIQALREAEIARLEKLLDFSGKRPPEENGVLLSDRIEHYCQQYKLIDPYEPKYLKPAGYDLRVGRNYSVRGQWKALADGLELEIGPYQVAIIETLETLNVPAFLIGRWNIRVSLAYEGLLWVGGAQVDPGFRGHLCCPIYNLSTKPVCLKFGDELAMIDFVATTSYRAGCKPFRWWERKAIVFPEYRPLSSGIEAEIDDFKDTSKREKEETARESERRFDEIRRRVDTFVTLVFMVVAVLFTGLGIVATKSSGEPSVISFPVLGTALALFFALRPYWIVSSLTGQGVSPAQGRWYTPLRPRIAELVIACLIVAAVVGFQYSRAPVWSNEIERAKQEAFRAVAALNEQRQHFEAELRSMREDSDAKAASLQEQIRILQSRQGKGKE